MKTKKVNKVTIETLRQMKTALDALRHLDNDVQMLFKQAITENKIEKVAKDTEKRIKEYNSCELLTDFVRVNLTAYEKERLIQNRTNLGYSTNSAFIRDVLLNCVTLKPINTPETNRYFNDTKRLLDVLDTLKDEIVDSGINIENSKTLLAEVSHLIKTQDNIRQQVVNIHNDKSAYLLAKQYLSKEDIVKLLREVD